MCHHNHHTSAYEHNDAGDQRRYEQYGDRDQRRHEQASHGSFHWMWFLFPFLCVPFFAFHAGNASSILFWVLPVLLFSLGMNVAFSMSHRQKAVAVPKDVPFSMYTSLSSRSDEQDAHRWLLEPDVQGDVAQQAWVPQGEQEVSSSPFADEQPSVSYPLEIPTQE